MALTVATNIGSLTAQAAASSVNKEMEVAMERLSTGMRINSAADDAAGIAISSRLTSEIRGTNQAIRNALDGQSMIDAAEGAHAEIANALQRMRELAVQASNDTNSASDRTNLQAELNALTAEIDRIAQVTTWAGIQLIDDAETFKLAVGARGVSSNSSNEISVAIGAMTSAALGVGSGNAVAGPNAATLSKIGATGIQVGGTVKDGDVFSFTVNDVKLNVKVSGSSGSDFTFVGEVSGAGYATLADADTNNKGTGVEAVATAIQELINDQDMPGLTATAAADGSVLIEQPIAFTASSVSADSSLVSVSGGTMIKLTVTDTDAADAVVSFDVNGTTVTVTGGTSGEFSATTEGVAEQLKERIAALEASAAGDFEGLNAAVSVSGDVIKVEFSSSAITLTDVASNPANSTTALNISTQSTASAAISVIDTALSTVMTQRASLGAISNRLDSTVSNLTNISTNLSAGNARIADADFAQETTVLARAQILQQASTAMLAQANAMKQNVLSLLQG